MDRRNPETVGVRRTGWAALDRDPQQDTVEFICPHCGARDAWRCAETAQGLRAVRTRTLRAGILWRASVMSIRREGSHDREGDALRFAEQRHRNKGCNNGALQND